MFQKVESGGGPFFKDIWKIFFQTSEAFFPYKGVFVTKFMKANIKAFIKMKIRFEIMYHMKIGSKINFQS